MSEKSFQRTEMLSRQLEYQSLKTVLLHMDPNVRFRIGPHMPSIRSVEKVVPLKMNHLELDEFVTKVNDTSYSFGIVRYYPERKNAPQEIKEVNGAGGVCRDFDEFGFSENFDNVMLPGDISFRPENQMDLSFLYDTERDERMLRFHLQVHEKALEIVTGLKSKRISVNDYLKSLTLDEETIEDLQVREAIKYSSEDLIGLIEKDKLRLIPFNCRRDNTKPPFTCYIQLTIKKGENKRIQLIEYTKKLFEAAKHLNEVLFGGRKIPIRVGTLDLTTRIRGICRLPAGFRLQVKEVKNAHSSIAHKSFSSIVENSISLNALWMYCSVHSFIDTQSQIVRNSKRLVIVGAAHEELQALTLVIADLPNREISIRPIRLTCWPETYLRVIQGWLNGDRPVGASFWIKMKNEKTTKEVLQLVQTQYEGTEHTERCITIETENFVRVEVFYDIFEGPTRYHQDISDWILKTRIVEV